MSDELRSARGEAGFTLLELLIAVSLMAVLAVLGWRGLESVLTTRDRIVRASDDLRALSVTFTQMEEDLRRAWPVRLLKMLARLPHEYATWLGWGHTIPNGDPARPYAPGTELCGAMVIPPFAFGRELFEVPGDPIVHVYQVLPLTAAEMDFKLRSGVDALLERMEAADDGIYGPLDAARRSTV